MWNSVRDELREIPWLVTVSAGLSIMGVGAIDRGNFELVQNRTRRTRFPL